MHAPRASRPFRLGAVDDQEHVSKKPEPELIRMSERGDVILQVGEHTKLLVCSRVLSFASKAFAAMFSPHFMGGQVLSEQDPPTIELPEDDPQAFQDLCRVLYYKEIEFNVQEAGEEVQLMRLVVLADKYDCTNAIRRPVAVLMRDVLDETSSYLRVGDHTTEDTFPPLLNALTVGYARKDEKLFWESSRRLLLETASRQSFSMAGSRFGSHLIPQLVWGRPSALLVVQWKLLTLKLSPPC